MTYSHNNVRNNVKMTTTSASKANRLKKYNGAREDLSKTPPPIVSTPVTAHSNSIASSTNFYSHQNSPHTLSNMSPLGSGPLIAGDSTTICSSNLAMDAAGQGNAVNVITGSFFENRQRQSQQQTQQQQQQRCRQQRQSPQQLQNANIVSSGDAGVGVSSSCVGGGGGFFYQNHSRRNYGGSAQRNRDSPRSPNNVFVRQSPAAILGGGISTNSYGYFMHPTSGSGRKQRRSPLSFGTAEKLSPSQLLIPTALTHFAGSKCFDAPAPTALPKPPQHWTLSKSAEAKNAASSAGTRLQSILRTATTKSAHANAYSYGGGHMIKSSKRNLLDEFDTHNLKVLLNVQS